MACQRCHEHQADHVRLNCVDGSSDEYQPGGHELEQHQVPHVIHRRWETEARFYETLVTTDLFGDRVLVTRWGGKFNRLGGSRTTAVGEKNVNEGLKRVEAERRRNGYTEV